MPSTWLDTAIREPGPDTKTNAVPRFTSEKKGIVVHSAEGSLEAAFAVLHGPRSASWHFTLAKDGRLFQHYPLEVQCWHAGEKANPWYLGLECEGVAGELLTMDQVNSLKAVLDRVARHEQWLSIARGVTLFEHNEFMATSCPSGRIPWELIADFVAPPAAPTDLEQIRGLTAAAHILAWNGDLSLVTPEDAAMVRYVASLL
jgi:hypothetical protein